MAETGTALEASRPRVFISHSREDGAFAGRLALILGDRGFDSVVDREDLDAAEAWKARVRQLIVSSDQVIVLLTANSASQASVRWEAEIAASCGKRIVVVVPAPLEDGIDLSPQIADSPWFHFYQHPTRSDSGIHAGPALENALKADLAWRRQYTSLFLLAEKWKGQQGADDLQLRGDALAAALSWRASAPRGQTLINAVAEFIDASERAETRQAEPAGAFEARLAQLEERRAAAEKAAREKEAAARAMREAASAAPARTLTPAQLANLPLAPVQAPSALQPSRRVVVDDIYSGEEAPAAISPGKRQRERAKGKGGLVAPALIALLMFAGAGAVVWQVVPQYLGSPMKVAGAETPAVAAEALTSDVVQPSPAPSTQPETLPAAPVESSEPKAAPPAVSPAPAPPVQAAAKPPAPVQVATKPAASIAAAAEPAAPKAAAATPTAGPSAELADWRAARDIGNIAAWRTYMLKWPNGERREQALAAVRKRIETLSTKPESVAVLASGPLLYRELPTFRDKGVSEGAAGQVVNFKDRIASPREGDWLVLERDGPWPFRFVSAREIEAAKP